MSFWSDVHTPVGIRGAVHELQSIRKEIKRLNSLLKSLREREKPLKVLMYDHLIKTNQTKLGEVTLRSVTPRTKRKPIKDKKRDAYAFFQEQGIDDVDGFWREFQLTQKGSKHTGQSQEVDDREVYGE
jgi:hypothetical protein